jgi:hypothetical protein
MAFVEGTQEVGCLKQGTQHLATSHVTSLILNEKKKVPNLHSSMFVCFCIYMHAFASFNVCEIAILFYFIYCTYLKASWLKSKTNHQKNTSAKEKYVYPNLEQPSKNKMSAKKKIFYY